MPLPFTVDDAPVYRERFSRLPLKSYIYEQQYNLNQFVSEKELGRFIFYVLSLPLVLTNDQR